MAGSSPPGSGDGVFFHNSKLRFGNVLDGLSNTLFVGERNSEIDYSTWVGVVHGAEHAIARIAGTTNRPPNMQDGEFEEFSSHHPGGTLFVFGDGSVRIVHDTIEPKIFQAMGTRSGGEVKDDIKI